jgi:hypothetical protein
MTTKTTVLLYNITSETALIYISEVWILSSRYTKKIRSSTEETYKSTFRLKEAVQATKLNDL